MYMYMYTPMSKLINISDDVYEKLRMMKAQQSYSEVLRMLLEKRSNKEAVLSAFGKGGVSKQKVAKARTYLKTWSKRYA